MVSISAINSVYPVNQTVLFANQQIFAPSVSKDCILQQLHNAVHAAKVVECVTLRTVCSAIRAIS